MQDKKQIRQIYLKKRNKIGSIEKQILDNKLFYSTIKSEIFKKHDIILAYYPIKNEPNILPIIEYAVSIGKKVAFPICNTKDYELTFKFINDLNDLVNGAYNIPEPREDAKEYSYEIEALCIVPALSFDKRGYRIGYGKGFYDRFLSRFNGASIGLCYNDFFCEELPIDVTDQAVDVIITDKEVLYVKRKA